uniref:SET domain-containing protein n=1 Tax=Trichuris muris TaxID=70415 RepID=A0A5S6R3A1_TRIMR
MVILVRRTLAGLRRRFGPSKKKTKAVLYECQPNGAEPVVGANGPSPEIAEAPPVADYAAAPRGAPNEAAAITDQLLKICSTLEDCVKEKYEAYGTAAIRRITVDAMREAIGFTIERTPNGVVVSNGRVKKNSVVCIYPGTVYSVNETKICSALRNRYVYKCRDGMEIDANGGGLARLIYRSCTYRDRGQKWLENDLTWMTPLPVNPLAVGQYVTRGADDCNVQFKELDLDLHGFPPDLRKFLPSVRYFRFNQCRSADDHIRLVVLIASRDIRAGERLLCGATPPNPEDCIQKSSNGIS